MLADSGSPVHVVPDTSYAIKGSVEKEVNNLMFANGSERQTYLKCKVKLEGHHGVVVLTNVVVLPRCPAVLVSEQVFHRKGVNLLKTIVDEEKKLLFSRREDNEVFLEGLLTDDDQYLLSCVVHRQGVPAEQIAQIFSKNFSFSRKKYISLCTQQEGNASGNARFPRESGELDSGVKDDSRVSNNQDVVDSVDSHTALSVVDEEHTLMELHLATGHVAFFDSSKAVWSLPV